MDQPVLWQPLLVDALAVLAATPEKQIEVERRGCIACDFEVDFAHARLVAFQHGMLSVEQRSSLDAVDDAFAVMSPEDLACGDNRIVHRPAWQVIRDRARIALQKFGWEHATPKPFVESSPGIWHRPSALD
jgi:hypothetical protein